MLDEIGHVSIKLSKFSVRFRTLKNIKMEMPGLKPG